MTNKKRHILLLGFLSLLFFSGCSRSKLESATTTSSASATPSPSPEEGWPDLIAIEDTFNEERRPRLRQFSYNESTELYEAVLEAEVDGEIPVASNEHILVVDEHALTLYDLKLKKVLEKKLEVSSSEWGPARHLKGHFLLNPSGAIELYNDKLELVSEISLHTNKMAHSLFFHNDLAYVLDNVISPLWILRLDTSQPGKLEELNRISGGETGRGNYCHLVDQWIDPQLNRWYVLRDVSIKGAQDLLVYNMDAPDKPIKTLKVEGDIVERITSHSPPLAVVRSEDSTHSLVRLTVVEDTLKQELLSELTDVYFPTYAGGYFERIQNKIFLLDAEKIRVFTPEGIPLLDQAFVETEGDFFSPLAWTLRPISRDLAPEI